MTNINLFASNAGLPAGTTGTVAEYTAALGLIRYSAGRLSVCKSLVDDHGADWSIYDKRTGLAVPLQIKVRVVKQFSSVRKIAFSAISGHLKQVASHFVLLVLMDKALDGIYRTWLFPATEIERLCRKGKKGWIPTPSGRTKPLDRYSSYLDDSLKGATARLLGYFDQQAGS